MTSKLTKEPAGRIKKRSYHGAKEFVEDPPEVQQEEAAAASGKSLGRPIIGRAPCERSNWAHKGRRNHSLGDKPTNCGKMGCPRGVGDESGPPKPEMVHQGLDVLRPASVGPPGMGVGSSVPRSVDGDQAGAVLFEDVREGSRDVAPAKSGSGKEDDWFALSRTVLAIGQPASAL